MTPAILAIIVQGIQAAIAAAPGIVDVVGKARDLINSLFSAGVISVEQQNAMHAHVDALCAAIDSDKILPSWEVQPDPAHDA